MRVDGGWQLGVDLGTSNTVAVLRRPDGRSAPLLFDASPLLSSAVYADPDGPLLVGQDALHHGWSQPDCLEPNPKLRVDEDLLILGRREVPVVELLTAVLRRVAEEADRVAGRQVRSAVLTCPAVWGPQRRRVLLSAAAGAGLVGATVVFEPVAAASFLLSEVDIDVPVGSSVLVYDFGAGTFDVSVVRRGDRGLQFESLARPVLDRTVRASAVALGSAAVAPDRLAGVFLVGGSSRIPLVATLLHRRLGVPPIVVEQPELVVAAGCLMAGTTAPAAVGSPAIHLLVPDLPVVEDPVAAGDPAAAADTSVPDDRADPAAEPPVTATPPGTAPLSSPPQPDAVVRGPARRLDLHAADRGDTGLRPEGRRHRRRWTARVERRPDPRLPECRRPHLAAGHQARALTGHEERKRRHQSAGPSRAGPV